MAPYDADYVKKLAQDKRQVEDMYAKGCQFNDCVISKSTWNLIFEVSN